jgi:ATP-binding cassette, subfamily C, bacterial LapB
MSDPRNINGKKAFWTFLPPIAIERSERDAVITDPRIPGSVMIASLVLNLLGLGLPLFLLHVYDRILPNQATETLAFIIFGLTVVILLDAVLKMTRAQVINWIAGSFTYNASLEAFRRLIKAEPARIEAEPVRVHMNRLNALTAVGDFYGGPSRLLLIDVPSAIIYLVIMWLIGRWIVLVPLTLLGLFSFLTFRRNRELRDIVAKRSQQDNRKYDFVTEALSGIHTVKAMAMEALMLRRFERLQKGVADLSYRSVLVADGAQSMASLYASLSTICILVVGASMAIAGDLSVGVLAACTLLAGQLIQPLMRGISAWAELQHVRHNFGEAMKLFGLPRVSLSVPARHKPRGEFSLQHITFEDAKHGRTIIEDLSLTCAPGEIVGLQSWDASERLILAQLFCGNERPTSGQVLFDGADLGDPVNAGYKDHIAYLGSTPVIFQGTILDNLTVFGHRADTNRARRIAQQLGLEDEINLLPDGYETKLGKGLNASISKAMTQWISIARTIAIQPKVLILDSATQGLDRRAAEKVLEALVKLKKDMAIILISQFESDLAIADRRFDIWGGQLISVQKTERAGPGVEAPAPIHRGPAAVTEDTQIIARNTVHNQMRQLEAELTAAAQAAPEDRLPPAQLCLDPLLMGLCWHGVSRHLYEALPHSDQIRTIDDLRAVLVRLNYMTEPARARIGAIDHDQLPCLFVSAGKIYVLLGYEENDALSVFDSSTEAFTEIRDPAIEGTAYFLRPIDVQEERKAAQRQSWLSGVTARFKRLLMLIFGLGFATSLLALALPIYTMNVYDKAIKAQSGKVLIALTGGMILVLTVDMMLRRIRGLAQAYFGARMDALISSNAFSQLIHMQVGMTETTSIGSQLTRLQQLENIREVFTGPLANALIDVPFVFVFIAAIAMIGGSLAWIPAVLVITYAIMAAIAIPKIRRNVSAAGEAKSKLQTLILEALTNQRAIRDISAERVWIEKFQKLSKDFGLKNLQTRAITFNTQTISQTLMLTAGVATLGVGTLQALNGSLTAGALIGSMALSWRVLNPLHQAFVSLTRLGQMLQSLDQVNKLMRLPLERIPNLLPSVYRKFQGKLELRRVVFAYPGSREPVLRSINCVIEPGEVVAITGSGGAGKSSIFKVILGLYPLQGGAILADGRDIRQLDPGEWRHAVSYVPKYCDLFYGTLAQNIALSNPSASNVEIAEAAREAGVLDVEFEEFLPDGIETRLTRQRMQAVPDELKQRLILARAFVKPSPFCLLDSPTHNLSPSGVASLVRKINAIRGRATVIMITQRPELIQAADRILHAVGGQIVWQGSPHAYMEKQAKAA